MRAFFLWFWPAIIVLSLAWYVVMLFYVGFKGGVEIVQMTRTLSRRPHDGEAIEPGRDKGAQTSR